MGGRDVGTILGQDVGHRDLIWITGAYLRRRKVLAVEIDFELFFSSVTIIAAAARALLKSAVSNDVDGGVGDPTPAISPCFAQPQSRSLGRRRHSSLIRSMLAKVVKSFPATR